MELKRGIRNKTEAQIMADFLWREKERHLDNINDIVSDLLRIKRKWKVKPRKIREWIET
jgi:hypothetical protein